MFALFIDRGHWFLRLGPDLFVFGELLDVGPVRQLAPEHPVSRLLQLFCFGTFSDYLQAQASLPPLMSSSLQ